MSVEQRLESLREMEAWYRENGGCPWEAPQFAQSQPGVGPTPLTACVAFLHGVACDYLADHPETDRWEICLDWVQETYGGQIYSGDHMMSCQLGKSVVIYEDGGVFIQSQEIKSCRTRGDARRLFAELGIPVVGGGGK